MFTTRELVLKTAAQIERRPGCYRYTCNRIPRSDYGTGCVLGWMAYFAEEREYDVLTPAVIARITCDPLSVCGVGYNDFFRRLDECYPVYRGHWRSDATHVVSALRQYAAEYPEAPGLPVWARMRDREMVSALSRGQDSLEPLARLDHGPLPCRHRHAEESMNGSVITRIPAGKTRLNQASGIRLTLITQRIKLGCEQEGGRQVARVATAGKSVGHAATQA
jgi:hypothetical protein